MHASGTVHCTGLRIPRGLQLYSYHARTENKALTYDLALSTEFSNVGSYSCTVVRASTAGSYEYSCTYILPACLQQQGRVLSISCIPHSGWAPPRAGRSLSRILQLYILVKQVSDHALARILQVWYLSSAPDVFESLDSTAVLSTRRHLLLRHMMSHAHEAS